MDNKLLNLAYQEILKSPDGRMVLWDILSRCHIFEGGFTGNSPGFGHYKEGQRDVGLDIIRKINTVDKEAYMRMMFEARRLHED